MKIKISPITNPRKGTKKMTSAEYRKMHNKAFPSNKQTLNAYRNMHNKAFPSPPRSRRSRRSRRSGSRS